MFNNLKAPRFNNRKYRKNIITKELFKDWKVKTNNNITFKQFKEYWNLIAFKHIEKIIEERDGIKLGTGLGDIYIGFVKSKKKSGIDYKTSSEYNKCIKHENWDSSGKLGKIIYGTNNRKYIYKLHKFWSFEACRNLKRKVSLALKEQPEKYKNSIEKRAL